MRKVKSLIITIMLCFVFTSNFAYANSDLYHYADSEEVEETEEDGEEEEVVFESKKVEEKVQAGDEYIYICMALLMAIVCGKVGITMIKSDKN